MKIKYEFLNDEVSEVEFNESEYEFMCEGYRKLCFQDAVEKEMKKPVKKRKEIKYEEVPERALPEIFEHMDICEYNKNRKEKRRHCSLDAMDYEGNYFKIDDKNIQSLNGQESDEERLHKAIKKLKPKQQELIWDICFRGISVNDYAKKEGVDHSAISHRLKTAKENLKKLF